MMQAPHRVAAAAQRLASEATARAEAAERALRDVARDRDDWKRRALAAEAELNSGARS